MTHRGLQRLAFPAVTLVLVACISGPACVAQGPEIRTVSSRSDTVSGGTALVELDGSRNSNWSGYLNGRDITSSFHRSERSGKLLALLNGLRIGRSTLEVRAHGTVRSKIQLFNHPLAGPIFSGPHQEPFVCQTEANGLGSALDADCAAKTLVQYYYKSTDPLQISANDRVLATLSSSNPSTPMLGFKPYNPSGPRPSDVAQVILPDGSKVNYIVRREVGVINRAVYEIQFLYEPGQPLPTPWVSPTVGWNGRIVYTFGAGCSAGYRQGLLPTQWRAVYEPLLAQGYALVTSSLNVLGNTCNDKVSAETASMVKEHFIKQYGEPAYTIGVGPSGGAVSVYLIAQNYPGILDGIIAFLSAPDIVTTVIPVFSDCALLQHAWQESKHSWTDVQKTAVSGFATWAACTNAVATLSYLGWLDPRKCDSSLPKKAIYDPISNPAGARCTFYDNAINVFRRDPKTRFAHRALDNVGIQYGLVAFNAGVIDTEQFVELNEQMGGFNQDGEIAPHRTAAEPAAIRAAYEYGVAVTGKSLANVPIIDWNSYADDLADIHTRDRALMTRARLIAADGNADNQVILVTPRQGYPELDIHGVGLHILVPAMDRWLANIGADHGNAPFSIKIARSRPAELTDGCIAIDGEVIAEPATYDGPGRCNQMYPAHGNPRVAAGAPMAGDILKCALKPLDTSDYSQALAPDKLERLNAVFSAGVCDYSKPGVGQGADPIIWHVYGNKVK